MVILPLRVFVRGYFYSFSASRAISMDVDVEMGGGILMAPIKRWYFLKNLLQDG